MDTVNTIPVPFYLLEGRHDYQCPSALAEEFFNDVAAPKGKKLFWFEESAHFPYIEENQKFIEVMKQIGLDFLTKT